MSVKISKLLIALATLALTINMVKPAQAALTIINFNDKTNTSVQLASASAGVNNYNYILFGSSYSSHGFTFQNSHGGSDSFLSWSTNSIFNPDQKGASLGINYGQSSTTISKNDHGIFSLRSLDLADVYNSHGERQGGTVRLDFTTAKGTTSEFVNLATTTGLTTFKINKNFLQSFSVTGIDTAGNGWLQMDNVKLFNGDIPSAVPEAATWLMMLTGFAIVSCALRRRESLMAA